MQRHATASRYPRAGAVVLALAALALAVVAVAANWSQTPDVSWLTITSPTAPLTWIAGPALPSPRSDAAAVVANDGTIFLLGGSTPGDRRSVHRLASGATSWASAPELDRERVAPGVGSTGSGRIVVFGGLKEEALKSVIRYNLFGDHQDLQDMGSPRYLHAYARDSSGRLYAIGGLNKAGELLASVERYDHAGNTWTPVASLPEGRHAFAAVYDGAGHILTFGGGPANTPTSVSATLNRYTVATDTWSQAAPMPIATRGSAAVPGPDGRIYVVGGSSGSGPLSDVLVYDPSSDSWSVESPLPEALSSISMVVDAAGRLVVIGGVDAGGNSVASVWMSQPLNAPDEPPAITSTPVASAVVGEPYSYQVAATGNPPPGYSLVVGPSGMTIGEATGLISWTPAVGQDGPQNVTARASNYVGQAEQSFTINVLAEPPDREAPSMPTGLTVTDVTTTTVTLAWHAPTDNVGVAGYRLYEYVRVNQFFSHWVLRIDGIASPSVAATGLEPGSAHKYAVTAVDAAGNESARSATLEVTSWQPPTAYHPIGDGDATVFAIVGEPFTYDVDATGVPTPTFSLVAGPDGMSVDPVSGIVEWAPAPGDEGTATATVRATNIVGSDDHTFSFPVHPAGTDLEPPGTVWIVVATDITARGATLTWNPATDNVGVAGYLIMAQKDGRGNTLFTAGNSVGPATTYTVTSLESGTGYRLWVAAYDAAGNEGTISGVPPAHITTLAAEPTGTATSTATTVMATSTVTATPPPAATSTPTPTVTATPTPTATTVPSPTATMTPTPTATATRTSVPTTPTATPTSRPLVASYYLPLVVKGAFHSGTWTMHFDGRAIRLPGNDLDATDSL